ncbi:MAG: radical SAM family heme chaperone HemW [Bacteroidales bacterium]|nr:radical SAM family heme chaperone HemW [Bacteroidales bacterium]
MIYIHIPFCHRKCTYCAFYSKPVGTLKGESLISAYTTALLSEMDSRKEEQQHPIHTIYFGGGTPSIIPIGELTRIVEALHRCFDLSQLEEMTIEANPEDLTPDYLAALRGLGFNRLSIGIQSVDDEVLRFLNRRHTAQQAYDAIDNAHDAGFSNISIDYIYGIKAIETIVPVIPIATIRHVSHVSAYALTVEPGTALSVLVEQGRVTLPDDDEVVRQYHALHDGLAAAGFRQYEVSNYARPDYESKHNSRYWDRTPYLGLGAAAHSFDGMHRRWNVADVERYIASLDYESETLTESDAFNEQLMTSLRTTRGLSQAAIPEVQRERLHRLMQPYIDCGWIVVGTDSGELRYQPTAEGLLHADGIASALFL